MKTISTLARIGVVGAVLAVGITSTGTASAAFDSRLVIGDLPGWHQTFAEGFDTPMPLGGFATSTYYNSKFRAYGPSNSTFTSWKDSTGHGRYMPEIMSVQNGHLTENIQTKNGYAYVAAVVPKLEGGTSKYGQLYGRFSTKVRFDQLANYKVAYLLWPDAANSPVNGEIDFPEINLWSELLRGFVHYTDQDTTLATQQATYKKYLFDFWTSYHVYTMEWTPEQVVLFLDGVIVKTVTGARVPHVPMHWVLQTETGIGVPKPDASVAGNVDIAWVAAWAYAPV